MQSIFMQKPPKAVSCYIKSLENGYPYVYGSVFCELFHVFWFKIFGLMPGFDTFINKYMANYFGAPFDRVQQPGEPGLKDSFFRHTYECFVKPLMA
jgi:hypothetical protein